jgi:hypothetical protein
LLLRNRDNLEEGQQVRLEELLSANQSLLLVYLMKEQLKELWYAPSEHAAKRRWGQWFRQAMGSGLEPLITFARRLKPYLHGIVASATHHLNTSLLEGVNNRMGCSGQKSALVVAGGRPVKEEGCRMGGGLKGVTGRAGDFAFSGKWLYFSHCHQDRWRSHTQQG